MDSSKIDQANRVNGPELLRSLGYECPPGGEVIQSPLQPHDPNATLTVRRYKDGRFRFRDSSQPERELLATDFVAELRNLDSDSAAALILSLIASPRQTTESVSSDSSPQPELDFKVNQGAKTNRARAPRKSKQKVPQDKVLPDINGQMFLHELWKVPGEENC